MMFSFKSYCDLSICQSDIPALKELCETLVEQGYRAVAVNQVIGEPEFISKRKKKNKVAGQEESDPIPEPVSLAELQKMYEGKLTIVNRLTFGFSDQAQAHKILQSPVTRKYHVLAAIPKSQAAYQFTCASLNVDIVTFEPENKYPVKQNRKMYNVAMRRGLYFELMYVPAMMDGTMRQSIISKGHQYHYFGKSKNILLSSNASIPLHVRGPYDVMNIGLLFGLSEEQGKFAVSEAGRKVLCHGACRRLGKIAPILPEYTGEDSDAEDHEKESDNVGSQRKRPKNL